MKRLRSKTLQQVKWWQTDWFTSFFCVATLAMNLFLVGKLTAPVQSYYASPLPTIEQTWDMFVTDVTEQLLYAYQNYRKTNIQDATFLHNAIEAITDNEAFQEKASGWALHQFNGSIISVYICNRFDMKWTEIKFSEN